LNTFHTNAFILNAIKYGEKKIICRAFTEKKGLLSFIATIGKKSQRINCFQAFTPVELHLKKKSSTSLYFGQKVSLRQNLIFDTSSITENSIRFFIAELLQKVIKEEEQNDALFSLLEQSAFDLIKKDTKGLFTIKFINKLLEILGIAPSMNLAFGFFDLKEGEFVSNNPLHPNHLNKTNSLLLANWLKGIPPKTKQERRALLNCMLVYLDVQLDAEVSNLKSKKVLEALFE